MFNQLQLRTVEDFRAKTEYIDLGYSVKHALSSIDRSPPAK